MNDPKQEFDADDLFKKGKYTIEKIKENTIMEYNIEKIYLKKRSNIQDLVLEVDNISIKLIEIPKL